jgi:TolB protein
MLVQRDGDIDLVLVDTSGNEPPRRLGRGNPFYYVWSADSTALLVHVGSTGEAGASKPELGIIRLGEPGRTPDTYRTLGVTPSEFRTPGWSADGRTVAFVAPDADGVPSVSVVSPHGGDVTRLAATGSFTALALSKDGTRLAWSRRSELEPIAYDGLEVVSTDGRSRTQVTTSPVVAFAWSPDDRRLAFATLDVDNRGLAWYVADADGSNARRLGPFAPTLEQIRLLAFFDQYATSHGLWSPDSSALVYAIGLPGEQRLFVGPSAGAVQVLAVDGSTPARTLTSGNFVALPVPAP